MKRLFALAFVVLALSVGAAACSADDPVEETGQPPPPLLGRGLG